MNILQIKVKNFLSYKDALLNLPADGLYLFVGVKGSGKSTLVSDAPRYAFYGIARSTGAGDNLIHNQEKEMGVGIKFEQNNEIYTVVRKRERNKKTHLKIYKGKEEIKFNTLKDGQILIERIIGTDYDTFIASACFEQGKYDNFSKLTPRESKALVMDILQLDVYSKYHEQCKTNINKLELAISEIRKDIEFLKMEERRIKSMIEHKDKIKERLDVLSQKLLSAQETLINAEKKYDVATKKLNKNKQEITSLRTTIDILRKRLYKLENSKDVCPLCKGQLSNERKLEEINKIKNKISENEELVKELKKKQISDEPFKNNVIEMRHEKESVSAERVKFEEQYNMIKEIKNNLEQNRKQINDNRSKFEKYKNDLAIYQKLENAFGKDGIPSYIIENIIPEFEQIANKIITQLTDDAVHVLINTQKDLKSGKIAETLEILIDDNHGVKPYLNYSGGEKFLIDFGLRIALSVILSRRSKSKIQTLILDEGFGSLDEASRYPLASSIFKISKEYDFKKILVITHAEHVKEHFNNVIKIKKDERGSKICI